MTAPPVKICLVAAVAENGVIGRDGALPWRIPSELKTFRRLTMGKPLVMGRKTFLSLGRPLDGRDNIVVTGDPHFAPDGAFVRGSLDAALALGRERAIERKVDEVMVIGGAAIFAEAMPLADRIYWTAVHANPEGDVTFPAMDASAWTISSESPANRAAGGEAAWSLKILDRVKSVA